MITGALKENMEPRPYYTTKDLCRLLSMHPQSIYRKVRAGKIPYLRGPGMRVLRFDKDEIHQWMKQRALLGDKEEPHEQGIADR
jgi:excisionase family DNA binding protein